MLLFGDGGGRGVAKLLRLVAVRLDVGDDENDKLLYYRIHSGNTLSEAAIKGREQDLEVIKKYMLAKLPEGLRRYAEIGSDRLRQLENEIHEVRQQLDAGAPAHTPTLATRIKRRLGRHLRGQR